MANTYSWAPFENDVAPSEDGLTNVIKTLHYRKNAVSEDGKFSATYYGSFGCAAPHPASFKEYEDVTNDDRIAWTEAHLSEQSIDVDAMLDAMIEDQVNPKIISNYPIPEEQ